MAKSSGGTILGNRYEILRKIGDGGMAFVYQARDKLLNRVVAVKVLRPEFVDDEEFLIKFKREAEAVASLSHPNIVNIYDVGEDGKVHYIVMEYVDGQNLKDIIKKEGRLDEYTALSITKQIAMALSAAHTSGVIHRDIKPHNILISKDGKVVKVADFGIAKAVSSSTMTNVGNVIGSVHYFSPEQAKGKHITSNADLYSLGIVLYEMINGKVPFVGDSPIAIALQHINENIEFNEEENERIHKCVRMIISRLAEKDNVVRYQNAEDVINDIEYIEKNIDLNLSDKQLLENNRAAMIAAKSINNNIDQNPINADGYDMDGYDVDGYDMDGYDIDGYDVDGYDMDGYDVDGYDVDGYDADGYDVDGYDVDGYDADGYDVDGYDVDGYDMDGRTYEKKQKRIKKKNKKKKSSKGLKVLAIILLLIVLGEVVFAANYFGLTNFNIGNKTKTEENIKAPNVIGMTLEEAQKEADKLGVSVFQKSKEANSVIEAGKIMTQTPTEGSKMEKGDSIMVIVSSGKETTTVPNVVGLTLTQAEDLFEDNQLKLGNVTYTYSNSSEGIVLSQEMVGGSEQVGKSVSVVVSKGPKPAPEPEKPDPVIPEPVNPDYDDNSGSDSGSDSGNNSGSDSGSNSGSDSGSNSGSDSGSDSGSNSNNNQSSNSSVNIGQFGN